MVSNLESGALSCSGYQFMLRCLCIVRLYASCCGCCLSSSSIFCSYHRVLIQKSTSGEEVAEELWHAPGFYKLCWLVFWQSTWASQAVVQAKHNIVACWAYTNNQINCFYVTAQVFRMGANAAQLWKGASGPHCAASINRLSCVPDIHSSLFTTHISIIGWISWLCMGMLRIHSSTGSL